MNALINLVVTNYIWFLVGAIIILLAIIGRYADKSNFGRGDVSKDEEKTEDPLETVEDKTLEELMDESKDAEVEDTQSVETEDVQQEEVVAEQPIDDNVNLNSEQILSDENIKKLDEEFDSVIPQSKIVNEGLLEEIDELSFDKSKNLGIMDIPDVDDLDLPDIKDLSSSDDDIWKF